MDICKAHHKDLVRELKEITCTSNTQPMHNSFLSPCMGAYLTILQLTCLLQPSAIKRKEREMPCLPDFIKSEPLHL